MIKIKLIDVAIGIIFNEQEEVLITKRSKFSSCASLWEFPGGKIEHNETPEQALIREIKEEVGIENLKVQFWLTHQNDYVKLHVFFVSDFTGQAKCRESQQDLKWLPINALDKLAFPETNYFLISKLTAQNPFKNLENRLDMNEEQEAKMVRWRCNRGMLELDLLLIPFSENHFKQLDKEKKAEFIALLTHEDPTLFAWLMGHEEVSPPMRAIVKMVKDSKKL